ncbi:TPA: hypothetical protein QB072_001953 [Pasteurella multocida]|uniref:hypothetical protein n=1 Tax=Pasteurella multocida TaxID=747 RepID=UPI00027B23E1|nr:hypothetical protein [Pasteurella multocida]APB78806.1 hypothetical protein BMF22_01625 [Pasteurella multocida]EJS83255.1 hypothetical protein KCU_11238 [Pasteurella multocida subsp. multocida str. P52VAC]EPE74410.1 hypothetical protein I010_09511 [Pasteurella multocida 1500C]ERL40728.1 hypothetical protein B654_09051 [Pasteurella multocida subsp. multocida str. PMTB]KEZ08569.1 hypothetical protein GJ37_07595 [Pasteurella multocida]
MNNTNKSIDDAELYIMENIKYLKEIDKDKYFNVIKSGGIRLDDHLSEAQALNCFAEMMEIRLKRDTEEKTQLIQDLLSYINEHNLGVKKDELLNEILEKDKELYNQIYFLRLKIYESSLILSKLMSISPKLERSIKGKTEKKKKEEQIVAEEWAKDIWEKDPTITQEDMAYQLKEKLDLEKTIQTIVRWIRPFQPKK